MDYVYILYIGKYKISWVDIGITLSIVVVLYPHPGPGFTRWRLIQAALTVFVIIKADLKFFSLIYTWVKMSRRSKYHESVGLIKPSHNRANLSASPVSVLYIGEIHTFEYIG